MFPMQFVCDVEPPGITPSGGRPIRGDLQAQGEMKSSDWGQTTRTGQRFVSSFPRHEEPPCHQSYGRDMVRCCFLSYLVPSRNKSVMAVITILVAWTNINITSVIVTRK